MDRRLARPVLLIVEDDGSTRSGLAELLGRDWDVLTAEDGTEAVALIQAHVPDLVLADLAMPRLGGIGLLEVLQSNPRTREVPVVFLSGQSDPRTVVDCFSQGAADFIAKPGRPEELRARLLHAWTQARRVARLESLARTDELTGLHNFRALKQKLDEEFARAARYAEPLAVLLVDLDHLKTLNDQYGHEAGNAALQAMGEVFRDELREVDFAARFGGDEFVALLPHQTAAEAMVVGERLRVRLASRPWAWPQPLTLSIGIAAMESSVHVQEPSMLLAAADAALYRSKHQGRNRVEVAGPADGFTADTQ
ncbi:MAG TPA: diguanylate cyclase [Myxococcaceae bacterium]|jgi:two-component system cell cycle response regulator|nr:diguanylate cyclase [Myxococcaceae bacterium]